ncbi:hypothetical protein GCM10011428_07970 [Streptomyces violaceus]
MAPGIVAELARGKRKDVAVVAFDDVSLAEALEPALTVVAQDPEELGRTALHGRLDQSASHFSSRLVFDCGSPAASSRNTME